MSLSVINTATFACDAAKDKIKNKYAHLCLLYSCVYINGSSSSVTEVDIAH